MFLFVIYPGPAQSIPPFRDCFLALCCFLLLTLEAWKCLVLSPLSANESVPIGYKSLRLHFLILLLLFGACLVGCVFAVHSCNLLHQFAPVILEIGRPRSAGLGLEGERVVAGRVVSRFSNVSVQCLG